MVEVTRDSSANGDDNSPPENSNADGSRQTSDSPPEAAPGDRAATRKNKKRRKVNHACVYCRRSHMTCDQGRPCSRCIKRSIGHLCHDEPRETAKKAPNGHENYAGGIADQSQPNGPFPNASVALPLQPDAEMVSIADQSSPTFTASLTEPQLPGNNAFLHYYDWGGDSANQYSDMHAFHPTYMFNTSEMSNEYHLLNQFLSNTLNDESLPSNVMAGSFPDGVMSGGISTNPENSPIILAQIDGNQRGVADEDKDAVKVSTATTQRAKDRYYLMAADPAGTATSEQRMSKLLSAKYDAGLLKPFNYINGYARMNQYLERHTRPATRQAISRHLERFRPPFREKVAKLTDIELVKAEMWFERKLMDYDRVFASMAVPACCWRRTGEIFRGNQAMADLIGVTVDRLRDGKLAMHEIVTEESLVTYWDKFAGIAFEKSKKAILTSCMLRKHESKPTEGKIKCCFSFTVQRDEYEVPGLIIGNFLPVHPNHHI